jgi:multiple sugar transport system permease protein
MADVATIDRTAAQTTLEEGLKYKLERILGKDWRVAWVFMLPTVILMGGLIAYPFFRAVYISFTNTISLDIGPWVGLTNYINLWQDIFFRRSVMVTAKYTISAVGLKIVIGVLISVLLHRLERRFSFLTGLVLLPWIMPGIVRAITWKGLLDPLYGGVDRVLMTLGITDQPLGLLANVNTALPAVIVINMWRGIPFFTINLLAGLKSIDQELYEAAAIDGASGWRQFLHITLPGLRYVLIVVGLLSTIWTFNDFGLIFLLTGGGPMDATKVYSLLSYNYAIGGMRYGAGIAVAMTMAPIMAVFIVILGRYMMSGRRLYAESEQREYSPWVASFFSAIAWPFKTLFRGLAGLFWLINNAIEGIFESIGKLFQRGGARALTPEQRAKRARVHRVTSQILPLFTLALLIAFELLPFYWVIITAFKTELQITRFENVLWPQPWTMDQFKSLLGPKYNFMIWLRNTAFISLITPVISTLVAALGAYALTRLRWRGANVFSRSVLVVYLMPGIMMLIPMVQLFTKLRLNNSLMALIIAYPTSGLPFAIWLMMGYYSSIPEELEAAALIDGCNRFQAFFRVVLPLTRPALMAVAMFGVTQAWSEFLFAYVIIHSENKMTVPVGLAQMIIGDVLPWGELCAAAILISIPVLAFYILGQRFMVAGLTAGAVKGGG